jgi:hypothetical protein
MGPYTGAVDGGKTTMETGTGRTLVLRIGGMTCINCQNRIEKQLTGTAGVEKAEVSYVVSVNFTPLR